MIQFLCGDIMISLKAFAKVNLSLYVTGIRNDGYHLLDTVMQTVSIYDTVEISVRNDTLINVTCNKNELEGEENICYKAAELFFDATKIAGGTDINITKRIPVAAGLGGGSADAAAVLKGLNSEFGLPLSDKELLKLALKLGADVPFCIKGGTARVKGIGEEIIPIKCNLPLYMLLIKDGEKPSTAYMYKELDNRMRNVTVNASADNVCKALTRGDYESFTNSLYNEFSVLWNIETIKEKLMNGGADGVCISGSGPTVIGFFKTKEMEREAYNLLKENYGYIYLAESVTE